MKLARKYRKRHRRHRDNPATAPRKNPALGELTGTILPGFAGFAAARFVTRMATIAAAKKWPKFARHAGVIAGLGTVAAAWYGAHRVKALAKYQDGLVVGSAIGAITTVIQTYVPKLGWVVAEVAPAELAAPAAAGELGADLGPDEEWGYYNDAFSSGRYPAPVARTPSPAPGAAVMSAAASQAADEQQAIDNLMAEISADGGGGIFAGGN